MRVLLVSFQFPPEMTGNAPLLGELCEDLSAGGHEVKAIAGPLHHSFEDVPSKYRRGLLTRERISGADVCRVNSLSTGSMWANKLIGFVLFPVMATLLGTLERRPDVILCPSPPLWLGLAARTISLLKGRPYVWVAQDLWPAAPVRLGLWRNKLLIGFFQWMERYVYTRAARVVVIAEEMRDDVAGVGVPEARITTIQNWVDTKFIRPLERDNSFRREISEPGDFVVLYSGNMGHSHAIDVVLRAAAELAEHRDIRFVLVGAGTQKRRLMQSAAEMSLDRVLFLPLQPRERLPEVLAAADVCAVPLRRGLSTASLPSKIYTYMAAGRPLVASLDRGEAAWRLIEAAGSGLVVEPECPSGLAAAIMKLYRDREFARRCGESGRRYVEANCDRALCTTAYRRMLTEVARTRIRG